MWNLGLLGAAGGAAAGSYWMSLLGDTNNDYAYSLTTDSANNIIVAGRHYGASSIQQAALIQLDPDGVPLFQKSLAPSSSSYYEYFQAVTTDSSDNIYAVGQGNGTADTRILFAKYDSSGTLQWQKELGYSGENVFSGYQVVTDSLDNVYVSGAFRGNTSGSADFGIAKYNSSGVEQWKRIYGGASDDTARALAIDSNDNLYIAGYTESYGAGYRDMMLIQVEVAFGTPNWTRTLGGTSTDDATALAIDSQNNVYVSGLGNDGTLNGGLIAKYNSSGTLQWQKIIPGLTARGIAADADDNIYQTGYASLLGTTDHYVLKYDSSGTLQWQRVFKGSENNSDLGYDIAVDSNGDLVTCGAYRFMGAGNYEMMIARLPADGSLTGTYAVGSDSITYAPASLTVSTSSLTAASQSVNSNNWIGTTSTPTFTDGTLSLTQSITGGPAAAEWVDDAILPPAEENVAYSYTFSVKVANLGTTITYSLLSGSIPGGMTFNASTATLSGSSTESPGTLSVFTLRAVTSTGVTVDKEFTVGTVMQPKMSDSNISVYNIYPYTDQYYVMRGDISNLSVSSSLTNVGLVLVGGGASGTYDSGSANTQGGSGGYVTYQSSTSIPQTTYNITVGNGGSYSFGSSNPGTATSAFGYSANGGSGTANGTNGSNSAASIMTVLAPYMFDGSINSYTGLDTGYLGGSGSNGTTSTTPRTPGLGGGGHGIACGLSPQSGAYLSGGGGGGGGNVSSCGNSSVGAGGGRGSVILKVPNQ